jgi:hypothetical protein
MIHSAGSAAGFPILLRAETATGSVAPYSGACVTTMEAYPICNLSAAWAT